MGTKNWISLHWKLQGLGLVILTYLSFNPKVFHYAEYFFFLLLFISVGVAISQGSQFFIWSPLDIPLGLLVVWVFFSIYFSIDSSYSFYEWRKMIGRLLVFYWAMLVLRNNTQSGLCRQIVWVVVLGSFVIAMLGLVHFFSVGGILLDRGSRALVFGGHSHWLATYMALTIPFVFLFFLKTSNNWKKFCCGLTIILVLCAEFLSYSRAGWLAMASQVMMFGVFSRKIKVLVICTSVIFLVFGILFGITTIGYLGGILDGDSVVDRLGCWSLGIQQLIAHPFFGVGFGNDIFFRLYPGDPPGHCTGGHLHNTFMMFGMGSGIPAFLFLLWTFFAIARNLLKNINNNSEPFEASGFEMAVVLMVIGYVINMSFNYLFTGSIAYLFWILVAVGFSIRREEILCGTPKETAHP